MTAKKEKPDQKSKDLDCKFSKGLGVSSNISATFWTWKLLREHTRDWIYNCFWFTQVKAQDSNELQHLCLSDCHLPDSWLLDDKKTSPLAFSMASSCATFNRRVLCKTETSEGGGEWAVSIAYRALQSTRSPCCTVWDASETGSSYKAIPLWGISSRGFPELWEISHEAFPTKCESSK